MCVCLSPLYRSSTFGAALELWSRLQCSCCVYCSVFLLYICGVATQDVHSLAGWPTEEALADVAAREEEP